MGPMPERPSVSPDQNSSAVLPMGVGDPSPVTTKRRPQFTGSGIVLDELDGVAHGDDLCGVLAGDLDVEVPLEGMTSSTVSRESAPRSSMNLAFGVTSSS